MTVLDVLSDYLTQVALARRHSCLAERTKRSANALRFGLRAGSLTELVPAALSPRSGRFTTSSRSSLRGNTVRISIRVAAPSGANVRTDSKAFGSPRDSPCSGAIRSGGAISVQEIHSC